MQKGAQSGNSRRWRWQRKATLSRLWILRNRPDVTKRINAKVQREERLRSHN